jgi:hypothetical protein
MYHEIEKHEYVPVAFTVFGIVLSNLRNNTVINTVTLTARQRQYAHELDKHFFK